MYADFQRNMNWKNGVGKHYFAPVQSKNLRQNNKLYKEHFSFLAARLAELETLQT